MLFKKKNIPKYIIDNIEISYGSGRENSDKENSGEKNSDRTNYDEENSEEEN